MVVGIGAHYIKTAILNIDSIGKQFEAVDFNKERRENRFSENLAEDLSANIKKSVFEVLRKNKNSNPRKILFVLENGLLRSDLFKFEFVRQDPQSKIDMAEIKEFLRQAIDRIKNGLGDTKDISKISYGEIQNILIDGYSVENPLGFQGKKIDLDVFYGFMRKDIFELLISLAKDLNMEFSGILGRDWLVSEYILISQKQNDALLIDMGDASTDLTLIKDGRIKAIKSFDFGGNNLTQLIAERMEIGTEEAESLKLGYVKKEFKKEVSDKITIIVKDGFDSWMKGFGVSVRDLLKADLMPEKIYVGGEAISIISEIGNILNDQNSEIAKDLSITSSVDCGPVEITKDANFARAPKSLDIAVDASLLTAGLAALGIFRKTGLNALIKDFLN